MKRKILQRLGHVSWLRFGIKDRIIRLMHNPDTCESEDFIVPFFGATYKGNFTTFIDWSVYYYGAYAKEELRLFDDFLQTLDKPIVIDVGANIGHHTLFAALRSTRVVSFEPFMEVAEKLEQKIKDNFLSNVSLFKCALGEKNEMAVFSKPQGHNTGTGSFVKNQKKIETLNLPIRIGDELLDENNINDVDFIKIDTEGFEPFVLRGLKKIMHRCRPIVFFEWSQNENGGIENDNESLFPSDYIFFQFVPDTVVMYFFRKPTYRLDLLSDKWNDGNILAIPNEYIDRVKSKSPYSNGVKQIMRAIKIVA